MISLLATILLIIFLFFSGKVIESIKRLLTLIANLFLRFINLLGINVKEHEKRVKVSDKFKEINKDVKVVRKSNQNQKMRKSINISALVIIILSLSLITLNLNIISGNAITVWLFNIGWFSFIITSQTNMDITFSVIMFSSLSFATSVLYRQWIETKEYREAKKQIKQRKQIIDSMSSKELLDIIKTKDKDAYEHVINNSEGEKSV